eukprot:TRINITY_DN35727_c0_g1_i1.p1 TRINITY_DN35727_c0_g1~~TRINITY_DN35727_c0_g1_i1.p1  ORF type:complete len:324 (+),score=103.37 TRINITY_DN35727_c0_g1_i1:71-973(+)
MAAQKQADDWNYSLDTDIDHKIAGLGAGLALAVVLLVVAMTTLPYADLNLRVTGASGEHDLNIGSLTLWRWDLNGSAVSAAGTADETSPSAWKFHAMHFGSFFRTHRNVSDEVISWKLGRPNGVYPASHGQSYQNPATRPVLEGIRDISDSFGFLQTAMTVTTAISLAAFGSVLLPAMRATNQAKLICVYELVICTVLLAGVLTLHFKLRDKVEVITTFDGRAGHDYKVGAGFAFAGTGVHCLVLIASFVVAVATMNDPYPRGQGPNFPSEINGEVAPTHYHPVGTAERPHLQKETEPVN